MEINSNSVSEATKNNSQPSAFEASQMTWLQRMSKAEQNGGFTQNDKEDAQDSRFCAVSEIDHVVDWGVINDDINTDDISFLAEDFAGYVANNDLVKARRCLQQIEDYKKQALALMAKKMEVQK